MAHRTIDAGIDNPASRELDIRVQDSARLEALAIEDLMPPVLTLAEVAKILRCSKAHVSHLVNGKIRGVPILPSVRCGRRTLVRREALIAWMKGLERCQTPGGEYRTRFGSGWQ